MRLSKGLALAGAALLAGIGLLGCNTSGGDADQLVVEFTQFHPHVGQLLELRVVDANTGNETGRKRIASVPGPDFTVSVGSAVFPGRTYWVDFYADHNGNGRYDAPPVDHAWRLFTIGAENSFDTRLTFVHDTAFTDIQFP